MSACPRCGVPFSCAMVDDVAATRCWCTQLPALPAATLANLNAGATQGCCLCHDCLQATINAIEKPLHG